VIQLLPTISRFDAVSNHALDIRRQLGEMDVPNHIYAENVDPGLAKLASPIGDLTLRSSDLMVYHFSTEGHRSLTAALDSPRPRAMIYHNITPAHFFSEWSAAAEQMMIRAREQLRQVCKSFEVTVADSKFNQAELVDMGFRDVVVMGLRSPMVAQSQQSRSEWEPWGGRLMFVGRIVPNKDQEAVIRAFYYYQKYFDPQAKLDLIGSAEGMERYLVHLKQVARALGVSNVAFRGKVASGDLLRAYRESDAFVCLSSHEGFGLPIQEAMASGVPVVALDAGAVGETLSGGGILLDTKDPRIVASAIEVLRRNAKLRCCLGTREALLAREMSREYEAYARRLLDLLTAVKST
jgi:glycosyltransferase involved in cell wall biosynthesis